MNRGEDQMNYNYLKNIYNFRYDDCYKVWTYEEIVDHRKASGGSTRYRFCGIQEKPYGNLCRLSRRMILSLLQHILNIAVLWIPQDGNGIYD